MGSTELGLDLKPTLAIRAASDLLREGIGDGEERVVKLEEYVRSLEEERTKIEAFKRELPFCLLIINKVVDELKDELAQCRIENVGACPVLEEFMPIIRSKFGEDGELKTERKEDFRDKMNWMSTAQLWSHDCSNNDNNTKNHNNSTKNKRNDAKEKDEEELHHKIENPPADEHRCSNNIRGGGVVLPFKGLSGFPVSARKEEIIKKSSRAISSLPEQQQSGSSSSNKGSGSRSLVPSSASIQSGVQAQQQQQQQQQASRKARRCWSPELHRRFVSALQQLGGSQVATPKQIRELMMVDGLTNDEVKSHLQKYRLHTRRLPSASTLANQQVVMLEGHWAPPDHYPVSKTSNSQSDSPQGPLQLANSARGISITGEDSCEEDDGKSESYSWKGNLQRSAEEETE